MKKVDKKIFNKPGMVLFFDSRNVNRSFATTSEDWGKYYLDSLRKYDSIHDIPDSITLTAYRLLESRSQPSDVDFDEKKPIPFKVNCIAY